MRAYLGSAGLAGALPAALQRHGSVLLGPLEQILHHLVGAFLLRRPDNLLPASLRPPGKEPAKAKSTSQLMSEKI